MGIYVSTVATVAILQLNPNTYINVFSKKESLDLEMLVYYCFAGSTIPTFFSLDQYNEVSNTSGR